MRAAIRTAGSLFYLVPTGILPYRQHVYAIEKRERENINGLCVKRALFWRRTFLLSPRQIIDRDRPLVLRGGGHGGGG